MRIAVCRVAYERDRTLERASDIVTVARMRVPSQLLLAVPMLGTCFLRQSRLSAAAQRAQ